MTAYGKQPDFIVKEEHPFNGEPPLDLLRRSWLTPTPLFFARNHGTTPDVDPGSYRLAVVGKVKRPLSLSLSDLQSGFERRRLGVTLQCAGNRRAELAQVEAIPGELPWGAGAIGTAEWGGVLLKDVLMAAGIEPEVAHVTFHGLDQVERQGQRVGFGGSIPAEKALGSEVLLADEMNGQPLLPVHGFPLRVVVPGYIGARSVKWLAEIRAQDAPSDNYFYTRAYQLFPPGERADTVDWSLGVKLGELGVNAVICRPGPGEKLLQNPVVVQGYAISGGRRIVRVEVSIDAGESWVTAQLENETNPWAWRFWQASLDLPPGAYQVTARAWDSAGNTQPEYVRTIWNFKGYMNNAWHRVSFEFI
jgi:sulfite oxidase